MADRLLHPPPYFAEAEPLLSEEDLSEEDLFDKRNHHADESNLTTIVISSPPQPRQRLSRSRSRPSSHDVGRPSDGSAVIINTNGDDPTPPFLRMTSRYRSIVGSVWVSTFFLVISITYLVFLPIGVSLAGPGHNVYKFWCSSEKWPGLRDAWGKMWALMILAAAKYAFCRIGARFTQQTEGPPLGSGALQVPSAPAETLVEWEAHQRHERHREEWRRVEGIQMVVVGLLISLYMSYLDWNKCAMHS